MAAATYNLANGTKPATAAPALSPGKLWVERITIDFADHVVANGESASVILIPPGTLMIGSGSRVTTADTTTGVKFDLGDEDAHNTYLAVADDAVGTLNSDGSTGSATAGITLAATRFFSAANDLRVTAHTGDLDTAVIEFWAVLMKCSGA